MPGQKRKKTAQPLRVGGDDPRTATRFAPQPGVGGAAAETERQVKRERRQASKEQKRRREQLVRRLALRELEALRAGFALDGPGWESPPLSSRQNSGGAQDLPLGAAAITAELRLAACDTSLHESLPHTSQALVRLIQDVSSGVTSQSSVPASMLSASESVAIAILCEEYMDHLLRPSNRCASSGDAQADPSSTVQNNGAQLGTAGAAPGSASPTWKRQVAERDQFVVAAVSSARGFVEDAGALR